MSSLVGVVVALLASTALSAHNHHQHVLQHSDDLQTRDTVPSYVLQYAPLMYLYPNETYFPTDLSAFLTHVHPTLNTTNITSAPSPLTLSNVGVLNNDSSNPQSNIYLTSNPGILNIDSSFNGVPPNSSGATPATTASVIVTVAKPNNTVDAFYFFFYAYNLGDEILAIPGSFYGNHVGDWEHTMIRFVNDTPQTMYFSQHDNGEAFTYACLQKSGDRPIGYVANGTHANYAINGTHGHDIPDFNLPNGVIEDYTGQGLLWDSTLEAYFYSYDNATSTFTAYNGQDSVSYLDFLGCWGDPQLPDSNPAQEDLFGQYKYVGGPTGPVTKNLGRTAVCEAESGCVIQDKLNV